jgi:hypothetical protein
MADSAQFRVTEYIQHSLGGQNAIRAVYYSLPMSLRDASRFAAVLSYARSTYVNIASQETTYQEWWFAGSISKQADVPPIGGVR